MSAPVIEVFARIERELDSIRYHFVIVDYVGACVSGALCAADDAEDVALGDGRGAAALTAWRIQRRR